MAPRSHQFYAIAFEENLSLKQLSPFFPEAKITAHELYLPLEPDGGMYVYPFGAVVMHDVPPERRASELARLRQAQPKLTTKVIGEDYSVIEDADFQTGIADGTLRVDRLTPARKAVVALTVAQSAAMEYYENLVEDLFQNITEARHVDAFLVRIQVGEQIQLSREEVFTSFLHDTYDALQVCDPGSAEADMDGRGTFLYIFS